ncbi:MAG: cytochrome c [Acidobacteria bacterium]|nr:cytochrome c [Acidobacteriota bacterium]
MKLPKLLFLISILLIVLAGSVVLLFRGYRWWEGLALPRSVKPELGTTLWTLPAGSVGAIRGEPAETPMSRNQAASLLQNPEPATPASLERGKKAFDAYCAPCHGIGGHGDGPIAGKLAFPLPDLPATMGRRSDGYLYATIRNGGVLMPPQGYRIPLRERWDIVNYLRSIAPPIQSTSQTPATVAASLPSKPDRGRINNDRVEKEEKPEGDSVKGREVFEAKCQMCHFTDSGEVLLGPGLKGLFKRPPHKAPDGAEHDHTEATIRQQIVNGGGEMPPIGSTLSEEQLNDLIAYLQTL